MGSIQLNSTLFITNAAAKHIPKFRERLGYREQMARKNEPGNVTK